MDSKPLKLQWYCEELQSYFAAGVGFFNGNYGDYTLSLNLGRGKIYVRPQSFEDGQTKYRIEEITKTNGRTIKNTVGVGYMNDETRNKIHIKLGGYSDLLILG